MELSVSVIIPAFNEHETIYNLVLEILTNNFISNVVVVDDSPNDLTINELKKFTNNNKFSFIKRQGKLGRGSAVIAGMHYIMANSNANLIIEMDSDYSHKPSEIPLLIDTITKNNFSMVIASRYLKGSLITNWPLKRRLFSKCSNIFARLLLRVPVSDYTNGFRIYTRNSVELLTKPPTLVGDGFIALSYTLVRLFYNGFSIGEVPSVFNNRVRGISSLGLKEITNAFVGVFKIYFYRLRLLKLRSSKCL